MEFLYFIGEVLGLSKSAEELGVSEMAARSIYAYVLLVGIARLGHRRLLDRTSAFDIILGILLGSIASRAITGNAPFYPAISACAVLVALHGVFAWIAFRSDRFSFLVKGRAALLIRDGEPQRETLRKTHVARHDIDEALRSHGITEQGRVALAHLERNGHISVVEAPSAPRVVDIAVAEGVQTVRVELR